MCSLKRALFKLADFTGNLIARLGIRRVLSFRPEIRSAKEYIVNPKEALSNLFGFITRIRKQVEIRRDSPVFNLGISSDFVSFSDEKLGGLLLANEDASEYRMHVDNIYEATAGKREHISRAAVESLVQKAILESVDPANAAQEKDFAKRLAAAMKELGEQLQEEPRLWEVHFPVEGISKDKLPYTFGVCEFYFGDDIYIERLLVRVRNVFDSLVGEGSIEWAKNDAVNKTQALIKEKTGVSVIVHAVDSKAAHVLAKTTARQAVDILNFYANLGGNPPSEVLLFSEGRGPGVLSTFLLSNERPAYSAPNERFGPYVQFSFGTDHLSKTGLDKMSGILKKQADDRTGIENRLVSTFQWAGKASVEPRKEEAFLWFAVSLESLLMDRSDHAEITEKLALRGAHLIGRNLNSRLTVYKDLKKLYGIRSKVVHSGSIDIGEDQLSEIRYYSKLAALTMLCSSSFAEMNTDEELMSWFRNKTLETA
jgi:hypothetical protein